MSESKIDEILEDLAQHIATAAKAEGVDLSEKVRAFEVLQKWGTSKQKSKADPEDTRPPFKRMRDEMQTINGGGNGKA